MSERKNGHECWEKDFVEFINIDPVVPPAGVSEKILATVGSNLRPVLWKIFGKLGGVQAGCALLTLFFCPQFEIGFTKHDHLAALVQHSDGIGFMFVCGILFLSGGAAVAAYVLSPLEIRVMERSVLVYFPTASLCAVALFYLLGADISWNTGLPWGAGGTLGSMIAFGGVAYIRGTKWVRQNGSE